LIQVSSGFVIDGSGRVRRLEANAATRASKPFKHRQNAGYPDSGRPDDAIRPFWAGWAA
jgi:hypothetical protein